MGFSRQEYWSGLPFPSQGELPDPGIECRSPVLQADSLSLSHQESLFNHYSHCNCPKSRAIQTVKTILKEWRNRFSPLISRQEYWSGLPCSPLREDPGIEPTSLLSPALAGRFFKTNATRERQPYSSYKVKL